MMKSAGISVSTLDRFVLLVSIGAVLCPPVRAAAERARLRMDGDTVVLETDYLVYAVGTDGSNRAFTDRATGKNYLDPDQPGHFMFIQSGGRWIGSTAVELAGPFLHVCFGDSAVRAKIHVQVRPRYLTLEITAVNASGADQVDLVRLPLALRGRVSHTLTSARDDQYAAAVIPLNLETTSYVQKQAVLVGHADRAVRLVGARVAVIGCPTGKLLDVIEQVEIENGLPHPTLGGVWARRSAEQMKSYLFVDLSARNTDAMIDYAVTGSFGYIVVYDGVWSASHGTYPVNEKNFPGGAAELKAVSDKIHAAGLKFGMHNLDMVVDKTSPLVHPVPDRGFMMYPARRRVLGADIGPADTFIPTSTSPTGLLAKADKSRFHGRDLRIGDEIVIYDDLQTAEPYGFAGCTRGAHGTVASAHAAGAAIDNFSEFIGFYRPDVKSDLYDRVASAEAAALDQFQFDYIYPDGIGENLGHWPEGPRWYINNLLVSKLFHYTRREVMFGHEPISNYSWHVFSRGNTTDFVYTGIIEHFDRVSVAGAERCTTELQPFEFGWFGYFTHGLDRSATRPREMEYAWSKALAYGAAMSLETNKAALDGNGRTREIFSIIKNWEELKLAGTVPARIRERLKAPGHEFSLERRQDGNWAVLPVSYGPEQYIASLDENQQDQATWDFDNPHGSQPLRVSIEARPRLAAYGHADNIVLLEPGPLTLYTEGAGPLGRAERQTPGLQYRLEASAERTPDGEKCFQVSAANDGTTAAGWGCAEVLLDGPQNLSRHRALGTRVAGDGSGAYLHFVVEDSGRWSVRDYYVKLDFTGWRNIMLHQSARGEVYDFAFPYSSYWSIRNINFAAISRVYVFISGVPPGKTVQARFTRLEALAENALPLQNPSLAVNGQSVTFAVTIEPDGYLEFQGAGQARVFDANGFTKASVLVPGPNLKPGRNEIRFSCKRGPQLGETANVIIHTQGEPLQEQLENSHN